MSDLPIQQSQKEFEHMARLQQERAHDRQITENQSDNPADNFEHEDIDPEDFEEAKINVPSQPSFPLAMFGLALLIDTSIIFTGGLLGFLFGGIYALILWLWARGKVSMVQKYIIKILTKKMGRYCIKKSIPILNWLPQSAWLILWLHHREKKYIGDILQALEKLEGSK